LQARVKSVKVCAENAIFNHDFQKARALLDEEGRERDRLVLLCRQHGVFDWMYD
jgi:hypothetical protein